MHRCWGSGQGHLWGGHCPACHYPWFAQDTGAQRGDSIGKGPPEFKPGSRGSKSCALPAPTLGIVLLLTVIVRVEIATTDSF